MELLKQGRVVFLGLPDSGKSTIISAIVKYLSGKIISPDTLMNEVHWSDGKDPFGNPDTRTIKAAKIQVAFNNYELMLIDAPGHLEYKNQIEQAINLSSIAVFLIDETREKSSLSYNENLLINFPELKQKSIIYLYTHSKHNSTNQFNSTISINQEKPLNNLLQYINDRVNFVDIEEEALDICKNSLAGFKRIAALFSGGKDSIVGNDILKKNNINYSLIFPWSGFDFKELEKFIKDNYKTAQWISNLPKNMNYENTSVFDIHSEKAKFNNKLEISNDCLCINYRASDEGVRSKDHYIKFGTNSYRFSPVFYFSEENIWRYISKYNLKYPNLYLEGYRSLGDYPVTNKSMPSQKDINTIIKYIHLNPFEERCGRKSQDNSTQFGMEKLRNLGFF